MEKNKDGLMTVEEFNRQVNKWTLQIVLAARATLRSNTHSSGQLANYVTGFVDKNGDDSPAYKLKFQFETYGVFRAYGAGRGYVVKDGRIVRGQRVRSYREIRQRQWNAAASKMLENGWRVKEINAEKVYELGEGNIIRRSRLDWIDRHINDHIERLADLCQEYHGDDAARQLLRDIDKLKIVKK